MLRKNQLGFVFLEVILIVVVLFIAGLIFLHVNHKTKPQANVWNFSQEWSQGKCEGQGTRRFISPIVSPSEIKAVWPLGLMANDHITPVDHQYYILPKTANVYAPAAGHIVKAEQVTAGHHVGYRLDIEFSCSFYIFINPQTLEPTIARQLKFDGTNHQVLSARIPIAAGQLLGTAEELDIWLVNTKRTLPGLLSRNYPSEPWKAYADSHLDYFIDPIKTQIMAKNLRVVPPRGGKIDYDIAGKLAGNWFKEGSINNDEVYRQEGEHRNDLAFAYDFLDPTAIRISIGDYSGKSKQFGVKSNSPDPKGISEKSGLVKYELVKWEWVNQQTKTAESNWDLLLPGYEYKVKNLEGVQGTLAVQVTGSDQIKVEAFPGKSASQVIGFTDMAVLYER